MFDREVCQVNLVRVAAHNRRHTKVAGVDLVVTDLQLEIPAVIQVVPLELLVGVHEPRRVVVGRVYADVLAIRARTADCTACEFHTEATCSTGGRVVTVVQPDKVADPRGVRVSRQYNVVSNIVSREVIEGAVAVCLVAIPSVVV